MKKFILFSIMMLLSISLFSQTGEWKEVQVVEIPQGTPVYYSVTESGNIKYCIKLQDMTIPVSKTNAQKFVDGQIRLELVKWYNPITKKFKYTTRKISNSERNVDLSTVFQ